jgi:hypothetical protein
MGKDCLNRGRISIADILFLVCASQVNEMQAKEGVHQNIFGSCLTKKLPGSSSKPGGTIKKQQDINRLEMLTQHLVCIACTL